METKKQRGRPTDTSKLAIWCRIDRQAIESMDAIALAMEPRPSRAQLIDLAVREFVERRTAGKKK